HWGPSGVATAWTISFWVLMIPALWYAGRPIQLGLGPILSIIWRYVAASVLASCVAIAIVRELPYLVAYGVLGVCIRIAIITGLFGALYLGLVVLLHQSTDPLLLVGRTAAHMLASRRKAGGRRDVVNMSRETHA